MADTLIQGTTIIEDSRKGVGDVWSCPGTNFIPLHPDTDNVTIDNGATADADAISFYCPVFLPNGVTITNVVVYGNAGAVAGETWTLRWTRFTDGAVSTMATANIGTEDTIISNATIDNSARAYYIYTSTMDTTDEIHGARIEYTI